MADKFYLTTPIFYPNARLHMGHAYTTTLSDILVRYQRLLGKDTYFLTGSDENTQKMVDAARGMGEEPLDFLAGIVENFKTLYSALDISYDQFIRTTNQNIHWPGAQEIWRRLDANNDIYKKEYEGLYCVGHEAFVTEKDLVNGKCPDHGTEPQFLKEENYFFRLSRYTNDIKKLIESGDLGIEPWMRKNEILAFLEKGLEDVSFSRPRKTDWPQGLGIPVPGDDSQIIYVWCDALANYVTALGFGSNNEKYKKYWPADVHVIGKDILRFHAAIWPGMLLSAGLPLPKKLLVHGFVTSGGKKMSKSLGNVIDPLELVEEYGGEAVRYYLARHISPFEDGDITREGFKEAYNANLANGLGNLVNRILTMAKNYDAKPLEGREPIVPNDVRAWMDTFDVQRIANRLWEHMADIDKEITERKPFSIFKTEPEKARSMVVAYLSRLQDIAQGLQPIMPKTSKIILDSIATREVPPTLFPRKD